LSSEGRLGSYPLDYRYWERNRGGLIFVPSRISGNDLIFSGKSTSQEEDLAKDLSFTVFRLDIDPFRLCLDQFCILIYKGKHRT
jgi:hypothetical protein